MRSLTKIVALTLLTLGLCFAQAVEPRAQEQTTTAQRAAIDTRKLAAIVDWLKADVEKGRIPGAVVLIARDGQVLLHEAVGWADKDKKVSMRRDSMRDVINAFRATRLASVEGMLVAGVADRVRRITERCAAASAAMARREAIIAPPPSSVAQHLVQGSLFDQRMLRASAARMRVSSALLEEAERRLETLLSASRLTPALSLSAILLVTSRRRA